MVALVGCQAGSSGVIALARGDEHTLEAIVMMCTNSAKGVSLWEADEELVSVEISPPAHAATAVAIDIDSIRSGVFSVKGDVEPDGKLDSLLNGGGINGPDDVPLKLALTLEEGYVIAPTYLTSRGKWEIVRREDFLASACD